MSDAQAIVRPDDDDYPTEPEATRALLSVEGFRGTIWEPFAGSGAMARVLREDGHPVYASTIGGALQNGWTGVDGGMDFFSFLPDTFERHGLTGLDAIVTNPPYGKLNGKTDRKTVEKILRHAITFRPRKIALLLGLQFLCGENRRNRLFAEHPPARVHPFVNRLTFWPQGTGEGKKDSFKHNHAWFVWDYPFLPGRIELGTLLNSKDFAV